MFNNEEQKKIWQMEVREFNVWRSENDIPLLLKFFRDNLNSFTEWMDEFSITAKIFCLSLSTAHIVSDEKIVCLVLNTEDDTFKDFYTVYNYKVEDPDFEIVPYLTWFQKKHDKLPILITEPNTQKHFDFNYTCHSWKSAELFGKFSVLYLGRVDIESGMMISGKNLDFTYWNSNKILGDWHGSWAGFAGYCSIRNVRYENTNIHHFEFYKCNIENLSFTKSYMQDVTFLKCGYRADSKKSNFFTDNNIHNLTFMETYVANAIFDNYKARSIKYISKGKGAHLSKSIFYKILANDSKNSSDSEEATALYLLYRTHYRKFLFSPYDEFLYRNLFPGYTRFFADKYKTRYFEYFWPYEKIIKRWVFPKSLFNVLKFKFNWFIDLLESVLWGYGRKTRNVIISSLVIVFFCSLFYYFSNNEKLSNDYVNSLYFSFVTFTTLGYGDISPTTNLLKLLCSLEAFSGAFMIGLFVASFSNRSER